MIEKYILFLLITIIGLTYSCFDMGCFPEGTLILTPQGRHLIEDLKIGDEVLSYDYKNKNVITNVITSIDVKDRSKTIQLVLDNGEMLEATKEHPIYEVTKDQYVKIQDLKEGNQLLTKEGKNTGIRNKINKRYSKKIKVYNLSVKKPFENYFANNILVHNKSLNMDIRYLVDRDLSGMDFSGQDFILANLSNANLTRANLRQANLRQANLTEANLSNANLKFANLREANLTEANLTSANLTKAHLHLANLSSANLREANLSDAYSSSANLSNANLSNANLKFANLSNANLTRANLTEANLSNANLASAHLHLADLSSANLKFANLIQVNLRNTDLRNTDLRYAFFDNTDFQGAKLQGALFTTNVTIDGVTYSTNGMLNADFTGAILTNR